MEEHCFLATKMLPEKCLHRLTGLCSSRQTARRICLSLLNTSIDLWLSHAPSIHSDKHSTFGDRRTVRDISQEAIGDFWRQKDYISSHSHLKGINYALEGYINNFTAEKVDEKLQLQAKM